MQSSYLEQSKYDNFSFSSQKKSLPINIPKNKSKENKLDQITDINNEEYSLNINIFNPGKMSPPNEWKNRLESRVKIYNSINFFNE